jgi:hypothetical protein
MSDLADTEWQPLWTAHGLDGLDIHGAFSSLAVVAGRTPWAGEDGPDGRSVAAADWRDPVMLGRGVSFGKRSFRRMIQ